MDILYIALTLVAGVLMPLQLGINSLLAKVTDGPYMASFISFAVGSLGLFVWCLICRLDFPTMHNTAAIPWWYWTGGLLGAVFVTVTIIAAPRIGAVTMFTFLIAGQMATSLLFDHFGLLGFPEHVINPWRILGVILLVTGVVLIKKF